MYDSVWWNYFADCTGALPCDDIWCGSNICTICAHQNQELVLEEMPHSRNKMFQFPHYILLDTCVVLNQVSHNTAVALF